jgi:Tfp pilus assembly protein PilF
LARLGRNRFASSGVQQARGLSAGASNGRDQIHSIRRSDARSNLLLGLAHFMLEEYSQALTVLRDYVSQVPQLPWGHLYLAITYARSGQVEEARSEIAEMLRTNSEITISGTARVLTTFKYAKDEKHFYDALRKAGLPE